MENPSKCSLNSSAIQMLLGISAITYSSRPSPRLRPASAIVSITFFAFFWGPAERNHDFQVGEAEFFSDFFHGFNFQHETLLVILVIVPARTPPSNHGVFFLGLKQGPTNQLRVFIGFQVRHAKDDWSRIERRHQSAHTLRQHVHEKVLWLLVWTVALHHLVDLQLHILWHQPKACQCQRVDSYVVCKDKLHPAKPNTITW
mmetsp:Transcript_6885/g.41998  ORF Transcript_6885/g.41998 Transcript_6885/m.41998 type:complete len:201 (+) Transcript_6885:537-1139(+)